MQWKTLRGKQMRFSSCAVRHKQKIPRQPSEDFCGSALPTANVFSRHDECQRTVQRWKRPFHWRKPVSDHSIFVLQLPQTRTCRGEAPPSCCTRPFCRLKAPLGLSLLCFAAQTRTFENTLISAACKKKRGKLWQKERGLDTASPLDKVETLEVEEITPYNPAQPSKRHPLPGRSCGA